MVLNRIKNLATRKKAIERLRRIRQKRRAAYVEREKVIPRDYAGFGVYRFNSSTDANYARHGQDFIKSFKQTNFQGGNKRKYELSANPHGLWESTRELHITALLPNEQAAKFNEGISVTSESGVAFKIASLSLGFERNTLIVESIHGNREYKSLSNEFWRVTKQKPLDTLLQEAEKHARALGFSEIKIRRPETLYYYTNPFSEKPTAEVQRNMRAIYAKLATKHGYKKEEFYYVKTL